jgi:hypothetical protein
MRAKRGCLVVEPAPDRAEKAGLSAAAGALSPPFCANASVAARSTAPAPIPASSPQAAVPLKLFETGMVPMANRFEFQPAARRHLRQAGFLWPAGGENEERRSY